MNFDTPDPIPFGARSLDSNRTSQRVGVRFRGSRTLRGTLARPVQPEFLTIEAASGRSILEPVVTGLGFYSKFRPEAVVNISAIVAAAAVDGADPPISPGIRLRAGIGQLQIPQNNNFSSRALAPWSAHFWSSAALGVPETPTAPTSDPSP